jgi:hypothetical protein
MPGYEDDSRFARALPEFAANGNYSPGMDFRRAKGFQTDSIEHARLQQLVPMLLSVKKIERKSLKAENAAPGQV